MLLGLLLGYLSVLAGVYLATVALILADRSWGRLPQLYLRIVSAIQDFFPKVYPPSTFAGETESASIIEKPKGTQLTRPSPDGPAHFGCLLEPGSDDEKRDFFRKTGDLIHCGLTAIVQDDLSGAFSLAPTFVDSLNGTRRRPSWNALHSLVFSIGVAFRLLVLLPIRLVLFVSSFVWLAGCVCFVFIRRFRPRQRAYVSRVYARLYCAATGFIGFFEKTENRPSKGGFAVCSHLTPNDTQMLYSDTDPTGDVCYAVTGQRHTGIIGAMECLVERVIPAIWLDRACQRERHLFAKQVVSAAQGTHPVIFYPEGYCTNNTQVLQFRRSIFVEDVDIFPVAVRQEPRFGDNFWSEDEFYLYLLRVLTSWATVYHVTYLPVMRRQPGETASRFACRVQEAIASASQRTPAIFDGSFWYKKPEQERVLGQQRALLATHLCPELMRTALDTSPRAALSHREENGRIITAKSNADSSCHRSAASENHGMTECSSGSPGSNALCASAN